MEKDQRRYSYLNNRKKCINKLSTAIHAGKVVWLLLALMAAACNLPRYVNTPSAISVTAELPPPSITRIVPTQRTAEPGPTAIPATITATVTPSATSDPYEALRIQTLLERDYGGGEVQIQQVLEEGNGFTRYLITYPSDGLTIYGFMNVPSAGDTPYPVIVALHGYIDPLVYNTIDYTTRYADALAQAGFLVLHPNLRGYPPSDTGENLFRVGMAVDVLNLIAIVQEQSGSLGPLEHADAQAIGLWGHSMGGGISTRVITVNADIRAAVLYGAMSGDERRNFEAIYGWSDGERGHKELAVPVEELLTISPFYYLDRIQAAVSIHHGASDELVPPAWSDELCDRLNELGKRVDCYSYPGQPHTFYGDGDRTFIERMVAFYQEYLRK